MLMLKVSFNMFLFKCCELKIDKSNFRSKYGIVNLI